MRIIAPLMAIIMLSGCFSPRDVKTPAKVQAGDLSVLPAYAYPKKIEVQQETETTAVIPFAMTIQTTDVITPTQNTATLSWSAPNNGVLAITNYQVCSTSNLALPFSVETNVVQTSVTLPRSTPFRFYHVRAVNELGMVSQ